MRLRSRSSPGLDRPERAHLAYREEGLLASPDKSASDEGVGLLFSSVAAASVFRLCFEAIQAPSGNAALPLFKGLVDELWT